MQDKKVSFRLGLSLLCVAILVPLVSSVNHFGNISDQQIKSRNLRADGTPIPPLPPPKGMESLVADGTPIPPLPPPKGKETLVADGTPIPPLPPPKLYSSTMVADGTPIPPLPPPKGGKGRSSQLFA